LNKPKDPICANCINKKLVHSHKEKQANKIKADQMESHKDIAQIDKNHDKAQNTRVRMAKEADQYNKNV
jgi:hypothetical protein